MNYECLVISTYVVDDKNQERVIYKDTKCLNKINSIVIQISKV
jgi:hypothetical protein